MNFITNLKIGSKLGLAFGAVAALTIALGLFSVTRISMIEESMLDLGENNLPSVLLISNINDKVGDMRRLETQLFVADSKEQVALQKRIAAATAEINSNLKAYEALLSNDEDKKMLRDDVAKLNAYFAVSAKLIPLVLAGEQSIKEATALLFGESRTTFAAASTALEEHVKFNEKLAKDETVAGKVQADHARTATEAGIVIVVLLATALGWWATRMVVVPVKLANEAAAAVAAGDLSLTIDSRGNDEIADLLKSIQAMQRSLAQTVAAVRSGSEGVSTASAEIASGNNDLSARTEQQASALEETAASMEELASTVQQNADNARQADQLAKSASSVAAKGGDVVTQVVETMKEINESSKRISDIISVIDGISFQTNILALNAAVEAARAGEQGRGFAVVASEVRSLAGRSAEAAKEIKSLIGASVERVEQGTALVDQAGQTMTEIVSSIQRVTDIMGEISAASHEQASGVAQIGEAVQQMDQVTQQNAALVEEMAAAASSLKSQAGELVQTVRVFKLSGDDKAQASSNLQSSESAAFKTKSVVVKPKLANIKTAIASSRPLAISPKLVVAGSDGDWSNF